MCIICVLIFKAESKFSLKIYCRLVCKRVHVRLLLHFDCNLARGIGPQSRLVCKLYVGSASLGTISKIKKCCSQSV